MLKSGLIVGVVALVLGLGATIISPLCAPCVGLLAGLVAGYLAGLFDKPSDQGGSAKVGASSGAIAGVGALIGAMIAAVVNVIVVGPAGAAEVASQLGFGSGAAGDPSAFATSYYVSSFGIPCCLGLVNVAIMAGLGALGGILWFQMSGKKATA